MEKMKNFMKLLLTELRMVVIPEKVTALSDDSLVKAMTLNENLKSLGFTFSARDIVELARRDVSGFFDTFKGLIDNVEAKPMYPDFPSQVMEIDEAVFRFHQMIHYFTTYGISFLTGEEIAKGWLPNVAETEKTVEDITLVKAKVLQPITRQEMFSLPFKTIMSKNERMTSKEKMIIAECIKHFEELEMVTIPFKENIIALFLSVMESDLSKKEKVRILSSVCQHTGDVWKCFEAYLSSHRWHLKTSEKKVIVALLETYPVEDFRANLIITNGKAERVKTLLEFLSYNRHSRSPLHKQAVADLRDDQLRSWQSVMNEKIDRHDEDTISFIAKRPGILLRSVNRLIGKGFDEEEIKRHLKMSAADLSMQTLVSVLTEYCGESDRDLDREAAVIRVMSAALYSAMTKKNVPFRDKKVFIDWQNVVPSLSHIGKSDEGGYVRSGMAFALPKGIRYLRFFVYWNDERELDVDLHASAEKASDNSRFHVGWNAFFRKSGVVHSGDITHSNAAEYIDVDLTEDISKVEFKIHSFSEVPFNKYDTCYTGLLAVSELGTEADVKLYDPKNLMFSHNLTSNSKRLDYGYLDVENNALVLNCGKSLNSTFTLERYMNLYLKAANATLVSRDEAELVLTPFKAEEENEVSILDSNFFMDDEGQPLPKRTKR